MLSVVSLSVATLSVAALSVATFSFLFQRRRTRSCSRSSHRPTQKATRLWTRSSSPSSTWHARRCSAATLHLLPRAARIRADAATLRRIGMLSGADATSRRIARCTSHVVRRTLHVAGCILRVASCGLRTTLLRGPLCCMLHVACCVLCHVACHVLCTWHAAGGRPGGLDRERQD